MLITECTIQYLIYFNSAFLIGVTKIHSLYTPVVTIFGAKKY